MLGCSSTESAKKQRSHNVLVLSSTTRELVSTFSATIRGKQDVEIRPKVSGYITDINVKEGSVVHKGQTMFIIDQVPYQAALQTAQANVDAARSAVAAAQLTYDSKKILFEQEIISQFDLSMAKTTLSSQKAVLAQAVANEVNAQNNLSYTLVKSPVDGVVGTLPFRVGTLVSPSDATPLTNVSDNSEMYVYFSMNESQVLSLTRQHGSLEKALQSMADVELRLTDGSIYREKGRIEAISGIIDPTTGAVTVRAKFPNSSRLLLSGGSGSVLLPKVQSNCLVIPQTSTFEVQDKVYVYLYTSGEVKARIVDVFNVNDGKEYVVNSGLIPGDTIVMDGVGLLRDGNKLKINEVINQ